MEIIQAETGDFETIKRITADTIHQVYPHYYPLGVVGFFLAHHSDENIMADIMCGDVYLMKEGEDDVGTVTINANEINRLFVLPQFQHKGYGTAMMDFAEGRIFASHAEVRLHASLPGKEFYLNRDYVMTEYRSKMVADGDWLCVDIMKKNRADSHL